MPGCAVIFPDAALIPIFTFACPSAAVVSRLSSKIIVKNKM